MLVESVNFENYKESKVRSGKLGGPKKVFKSFIDGLKDRSREKNSSLQFGRERKPLKEVKEKEFSF